MSVIELLGLVNNIFRYKDTNYQSEKGKKSPSFLPILFLLANAGSGLIPHLNSTYKVGNVTIIIPKTYPLDLRIKIETLCRIIISSI